MLTKLYSGGGESVAHSSVPESHGFAPATSPCRKLLIAFKMKTIPPNAMMEAPTVLAPTFTLRVVKMVLRSPAAPAVVLTEFVPVWARVIPAGAPGVA